MKKNKTILINFRTTPELKQRIEKYCKKKEITLTKIITDHLESILS